MGAAGKSVEYFFFLVIDGEGTDHWLVPSLGIPRYWVI